MQTVNSLIDNLNKLVKAHPECANWPIIYSSDDEGNSYYTVWNTPEYTKVDDLSVRHLDVIGVYSPSNNDVLLEECNCVIIN